MSLAACTTAPSPIAVERTTENASEECAVSIIQDGVRIAGANPLPGVTLISLKKKPFLIQVPSASCNASIGVFNIFEKMRSLGATKAKLFTTTGFEMAASPGTSDTLPIARDAERISQSDFNSFLGQVGMSNYQSVCKADGICPIVLTAFRSYHNFINTQSGQPSNQAQITVRNFQPIHLMVYTETKRFPNADSSGANWPADILLKPNPYLVTFSN